MPRLSPDAPDLVVSPDGAWVAELASGSLRLYDLSRGGATATGPAGTRLSPIAEVERPGGPGRIVFLSEDRLLHLWQVAATAEEAAQGQEGHIAAEQLTVPTLSEAGRGLRVPGCTRVVGV